AVSIAQAQPCAAATLAMDGQPGEATAVGALLAYRTTLGHQRFLLIRQPGQRWPRGRRRANPDGLRGHAQAMRACAMRRPAAESALLADAAIRQAGVAPGWAGDRLQGHTTVSVGVSSRPQSRTYTPAGLFSRGLCPFQTG